MGAFNDIRGSFVHPDFRQTPMLQTQNKCDVELGTGVVSQGNIVAILLNALRKRRDHNNGILHTAIQLITEYRSTSCDIPCDEHSIYCDEYGIYRYEV